VFRLPIGPPDAHEENAMVYRHFCIMAVILGVTVFPGRSQERDRNAPVQTVGSETRIWTGTLIDAKRTDCGPEVKRAGTPGGCPVSVSTTKFAILLPNGSSLIFDEGGNAKAVDALRRSRKGSKVLFNYWKTGKANGAVTARVTGTQTSDLLNVESVKVN
jgi:hypothetical protein